MSWCETESNLTAQSHLCPVQIYGVTAGHQLSTGHQAECRRKILSQLAAADDAPPQRPQDRQNPVACAWTIK